MHTGQDRHEVHTLVIGGGQAGLATSYWLTQAGIQHLVLERQERLGGSWHDRWDSFCLVAPNYTLLLPGMPYAGPDPDGFMPRDEVLRYVQEYAGKVAAPLRLGTRVQRLSAANGRFEAHTGGTTFVSRNVVLATGPYQRPRIPALSGRLASRVQQIHSHHYRRPAQLADGGVLVVGTGQSGTQIAEELHLAGREVHLAVSTCPSAPRRYPGTRRHLVAAAVVPPRPRGRRALPHGGRPPLAGGAVRLLPPPLRQGWRARHQPAADGA